jgi:hypothetical protein
VRKSPSFPIAFNPLQAYHLRKFAAHTVEGDGEPTVVGKALSHYKIIEKIGQEGFGPRVFVWKDSVWAAYSDKRH